MHTHKITKKPKDDSTQEINDIIHATKNGYSEKVNLLLDNKYKIERILKYKDKDGRTPLLLAITENHPDIANKMISLKADVNSADKDGVTPLIAAAFMGLEETVELLLQNNA